MERGTRNDGEIYDSGKVSAEREPPNLDQNEIEKQAELREARRNMESLRVELAEKDRRIRASEGAVGRAKERPEKSPRTTAREQSSALAAR